MSKYVNAIATLRELEYKGISISAQNDNLVIKGQKDALTKQLVEQLKNHKAEIIELKNETAELQAYPLTGMQQAYIIGRNSSLEIGDVASHVYHEIEGQWDIDKLEQALNQVITSQDALRNVFVDDSSQITLPEKYVSVAVTDFGDCEMHDFSYQINIVRSHMSHQIMDVHNGFFLDVRVSKRNSGNWILHVSHDGMVIDGMSMFLLFKQWGAFYNGELTLLPVDISYKKYVEALVKSESGTLFERAKEHWLKRLPDLPKPPQLPQRLDPLNLERNQFSQRIVSLSAHQWDVFCKKAEQHNLTVNTALAAAFSEIIGIWNGGNDFTLAVTLANRLPIHPHMAHKIGNFTSLLMVPFKSSLEGTLNDRMQDFSAAMLEAMNYRFFSGFEVIQALNGNSGNITTQVPVTFNCAIDTSGQLNGDTLDALGQEIYSISQTPQVLLNVFAMEKQGGLVIQIDAVEDVFPNNMLDNLCHSWQTLLEDMVSIEDWSTVQANRRSEDETQLIEAANSTDATYPASSLQAYFKAALEEHPNHIAVINGDYSLTYRELSAYAAVISDWLEQQEIELGSAIPIISEKGWAQIAAILGILYAGCAYIPIDSTQPIERIKTILNISECEVAITDSDFAWTDEMGLKTFNVAAIEQPIAEKTQLPTYFSEPDALAYILFTSGTTGTPKGVMVTHDNVINLIHDTSQRFHISPSDRAYGISNYNFDLSVFDIFAMLCNGGAVVIPETQHQHNPEQWHQDIARHQVTLWNSVPALVQLLILNGDSKDVISVPPNLRCIMMSGDFIPTTLAMDLMDNSKKLNVFSLGGPTETTVWNIFHKITAKDKKKTFIPYGRPNSNNKYHILDTRLQDCPVNVVGTLYCSGKGVSAGYWKTPELTEKTFFKHSETHLRLYDTGDIGRYLSNGEIQIVGRKDNQIKINGYRIELGEIQTTLEKLGSIERAVVSKARINDQDCLIAAYVAEEAIDEDAINAFLSEHLPYYMIPKMYAHYTALPLTSNNKVDHKAIINEIEAQQQPILNELPQTQTEQLLVQVWQNVLTDQEVQRRSNFFDVGGSSLEAIKMIAKLKKEIPTTISLRDVLQHPVLSDMAQLIDEYQMGKSKDEYH